MEEYHKITTVFNRDPGNNYKTLLLGDYAKPEFKYLAENDWIFTEKVDGTNIRVMWDGETIKYGGKTERAQIYQGLIWALDGLFPSNESFKEKFGIDTSVCLYGEGYGSKIQKGGGNYNPNGQDFVLFDVKIGDWWLLREDVEDIARYFDIDVAPIIDIGGLPDMVDMAREGFESQWGEFQAEGIVARPIVPLFARNGERIITKIKCKDFK